MMPAAAQIAPAPSPNANANAQNNNNNADGNNAWKDDTNKAAAADANNNNNNTAADTNQSAEGAVKVDVVKAGDEETTARNERQIEEAKKAEAEAAAVGWRQKLVKLRRSLCGPLHLGDLLYAGFVLFWFVILAGIKEKAVLYFILFIAFLFYFGYLKMCWDSEERQHLSKLMTNTEFEKYFDDLRKEAPTLHMETESWHWEQRIHRHTTYSNGYSTTTTTVTWVRRVTHTEEVVFAYTTWQDSAQPLDGLTEQPITFVTIWKEYLFSDAHTQQSYYAQLHDLQNRNRSRDVNMDTNQWMSVPGFRRHTCVYDPNQGTPILVRLPVYLLCCVCLLSWPIKVYYEFKVKKGAYTLSKTVTKM